MNRTSLPLHEIIVLDRQRIDLGDISDLADSIARYGLIQPIVVNQEKRLIAGGRRLAAHELLKRTHVDVVYRETLTIDELHELELEENVKRKEMSWQEKSLNIDKIHSLKLKRSALEASKWGLRETGEMLGLAYSRVAYNVTIAKALRTELTLPEDKRRFWKCDKFQDAWNLRMRDEEDALMADLAKETKSLAQTTSAPVEQIKTPSILDLIEESFVATSANNVSHGQDDGDLIRMQRDTEMMLEFSIRIKEKGFGSLSELEAEDLWRLLPNEGKQPFAEWFIERSAIIEPWLSIPLSQFVLNVNCIDWMRANPSAVDHIITDPPYGIDIDHLNQGNDGHAFKDIDTIEAEHTVSGNEDLFVELFPATYSCLKENGFFILWCDIMQWQRLYDLAINAGFKVQRWPLTWVKTHRCMNQSAQYNFTKSTEIAMVCRKGKATIVTPAGECHILASHDDYKDQLGHPFVKPYALWEYCIDHVSIEGQTILEPFSGRGSGAISLIRKKRKVIALEKDTAHYNALVENIKQHYLTLNSNFKFK